MLKYSSCGVISYLCSSTRNIIKASSLDYCVGLLGNVWWGSNGYEKAGNVHIHRQFTSDTKRSGAEDEWMHIPTQRGPPLQAATNWTIHFPCPNLRPCFASSGPGWPIWKLGVQVLPVGRYLQPHLASLCHIVNPPFPCYICFLFIKFPVWILTSAFLMSTTAFITDNNFLLQKGCIILHAFQITFYEQTLKYSIWHYAQLSIFIVI